MSTKIFQEVTVINVDAQRNPFVRNALMTVGNFLLNLVLLISPMGTGPFSIIRATVVTHRHRLSLKAYH